MSVSMKHLYMTIGYFFLFPRSDVSDGRRINSEPNERTYEMWRNIIREFNMEQLIRTAHKNNLRMECIFESDLAFLISNTTFKGYQIKFSYFNESLKRG